MPFTHKKNIKQITKNADILISAIGKAKFVTKDMVKDGVVIIDVGINRGEDGKLTGDVDFENVSPKSKLYNTSSRWCWSYDNNNVNK